MADTLPRPRAPKRQIELNLSSEGCFRESLENVDSKPNERRSPTDKPVRTKPLDKSFRPRDDCASATHTQEIDLVMSQQGASAADHLEQALQALDAAAECMDGSLEPLRRQIALAKKITYQTLKLLTASVEEPYASVHLAENLAVAKTPKGRARQAEAIRFIVKRYREKGSTLPVSSTEIIEGCQSLRSKGSVQFALREFIQDGSLKTVTNIAGVGGYVPTTALQKKLQDFNPPHLQL